MKYLVTCRYTTKDAIGLHHEIGAESISFMMNGTIAFYTGKEVVAAFANGSWLEVHRIKEKTR